MKFATLIAALFALSLTACGQKAAETAAPAAVEAAASGVAAVEAAASGVAAAPAAAAAAPAAAAK